MKKFTAVMLCALIVPSFSSAMDEQENTFGNVVRALIRQIHAEEERQAQNNPEEVVEDEEPAPQPNPDRLARMRAMQEGARRFAQRHAQNNPEEQQFEHECPICRDAEATIILPCNHRICRACLTNWATHQEVPNAFQARILGMVGQNLRAANSCPECRANIPEAFIRQELTDNISLLQKTQLRLSLLGKGFLNGLYWGSLGKKILHWWRSPYIEKAAGIGNAMFTFILVLPTSYMLMSREMRRLNPELRASQIMMQNPNDEDVQRIFWKHAKHSVTMNNIMSTALMLKTKNRSLISNSLHTNLLFPSLTLAEAAIPYMNKNYAYKLCSRTASKGWSRVGTCLGLYCTNRIYNVYNTWGSRMLTRAGIAA